MYTIIMDTCIHSEDRRPAIGSMSLHYTESGYSVVLEQEMWLFTAVTHALASVAIWSKRDSTQEQTTVLNFLSSVRSCLMVV